MVRNCKDLNVTFNFPKNDVIRKTLNPCLANGWWKFSAVACGHVTDIGNYRFNCLMETHSEFCTQRFVKRNMFGIFCRRLRVESIYHCKIAWILRSTSSEETSWTVPLSISEARRCASTSQSFSISCSDKTSKLESSFSASRALSSIGRFKTSCSRDWIFIIKKPKSCLFFSEFASGATN